MRTVGKTVLMFLKIYIQDHDVILFLNKVLLRVNDRVPDYQGFYPQQLFAPCLELL
jgi:hypothetical protein